MSQPQYITELLDQLSTEYSVEYYAELFEDYELLDCFILNDVLIKIDRVPLDSLSKKDMEDLLDAIRATYDECILELEQLGWTTK